MFVFGFGEAVEWFKIAGSSLCFDIYRFPQDSWVFSPRNVSKKPWFLLTCSKLAVPLRCGTSTRCPEKTTKKLGWLTRGSRRVVSFVDVSFFCKVHVDLVFFLGGSLFSITWAENDGNPPVFEMFKGDILANPGLCWSFCFSGGLLLETEVP